MVTKEEFISMISNRLGRPKPEQVTTPDFDDHPADGLYDTFSQEDLVVQFIRELEALSGKVVRVKSINMLEDAVISFLQQNSINNVVVWDDTTERGKRIRRACETYLNNEDDGRVTVWNKDIGRDELISINERSDAGVVYAEYGISETGTVVLYNKGEKGRSVSLLPNNIAIVLFSRDIVPRITQVLEQLNEPAINHSCINFISGPSRSADIEMSLSIGVHGPGKITVLLVDE